MMDAVESFRLEEVDPWNLNLEKLPRTLKEGLDLSKLCTTGADIEFVDEENSGRVEEEQQAWKNDKNVYREEMLKHLNPECVGLQDDACKEGAEEKPDMTPFSKMAMGMIDLTGDGQVLKKMITLGSGPTVPEGAMVRVHYNGYLEYADEPYDSSRLRNKEQQFKVGKGEVLPGWDVALTTMRKGELSRFLVQASYAFGEFGCPPRIPPNATILFEIELLSFVDLKSSDAYNNFTREEKEKLGLDELISVVDEIREEANTWFHQNNINKAAVTYRKAVLLLENRRLKDEGEEKKWKIILVKLYLNQSLCSIRLGRPKLAIVQCRKVLDLDGKNVKATFRLGQAHLQLSDFEKSRKYLIRAGRFMPGNADIRQELEKLDKAVSKFKAIEKNMCSKMFSSESKPLKSDREDEEDVMSPEEVQEYRDLYHKKFSELHSNPQSMQLMVPLPLSEAEKEIVKQAATEFNLLTEMIPRSGLKVYKVLAKEVQEIMDNQ